MEFFHETISILFILLRDVMISLIKQVLNFFHIFTLSERHICAGGIFVPSVAETMNHVYDSAPIHDYGNNTDLCYWPNFAHLYKS